MDGDDRAVGPGHQDEPSEGDSVLAIDVRPPPEDSEELRGTSRRAGTARHRFIPPADVAAGLGLLLMAAVVFVARGNNATAALLVTAGAGCLGVSLWYRRPERTQRTSELRTARERVAGPRAPRTRETMQWRHLVPPLDLAAGMALGVAALATYAAAGFSLVMFLLLVAAIVSLGASLRARRRKPDSAGDLAPPASADRIPPVDLLLPVGLMAAFAPLYLFALHTLPVQVSSDELALTHFAQVLSTAKHVNPFGISDYNSHPTMGFLILGKLGRLLGGVDLYHMRLIMGFSGLVVIGCSYLLFRQLLPRRWAVGASVVLGSSHVLLMISRMAMRENTTALIEVLAFALLLRGLRHDDLASTFAGGLVAGFGFYTYFPARTVFPLWLAFLVGLAICFRGQFPIRTLVRLSSVAALGLVLIAGPIMFDALKAPPQDQRYEKEALLLFPEGRKLQQQWVSAPTELAGVRTNIAWGLTTFNNHIEDHGWIYANPKHGFVDPLTGVLLWVGVGVGVIDVFRRRHPLSLVLVGSFVVLWLSYAFVVNKAPHYPRLLITLPVVAYLATVGARAVAGRTGPRLSGFVVVALIGTILGWNLLIANDFIRAGRNAGDDIGSTGRYVESRRDLPGERFYLAADPQHPYFNWSLGNMGTDRLEVFAHPGQVPNAISYNALHTFAAAPPFSMFMSRGVWHEAQGRLTARYPRAIVRNITPDGRLVALEVPRPT